MARSKLGFLRLSGVNSGQTWSNLLKISKELEFDINHEKCFFFFGEDFDLIWPSVNLGLTRGILVEKGTLSALVSEWVAPHHYICSYDPMERKRYFLGFSGSSTQIDGLTKYDINSFLAYWLTYNGLADWHGSPIFLSWWCSSYSMYSAKFSVTHGLICLGINTSGSIHSSKCV